MQKNLSDSSAGILEQSSCVIYCSVVVFCVYQIHIDNKYEKKSCNCETNGHYLLQLWHKSTSLWCSGSRMQVHRGQHREGSWFRTQFSHSRLVWCHCPLLPIARVPHWRQTLQFWEEKEVLLSGIKFRPTEYFTINAVSLQFWLFGQTHAEMPGKGRELWQTRCVEQYVEHWNWGDDSFFYFHTMTTLRTKLPYERGQGLWGDCVGCLPAVLHQIEKPSVKTFHHLHPLRLWSTLTAAENWLLC